MCWFFCKFTSVVFAIPAGVYIRETLMFWSAGLCHPWGFVIWEMDFGWFETGQKLLNQPNGHSGKSKKKLVSFLDGATLCAPVRPVGH